MTLVVNAQTKRLAKALNTTAGSGLTVGTARPVAEYACTRLPAPVRVAEGGSQRTSGGKGGSAPSGSAVRAMFMLMASSV